MRVCSDWPFVFDQRDSEVFTVCGGVCAAQTWYLVPWGVVNSQWLQGRDEEGAPGSSGLERTSVHQEEPGLSFLGEMIFCSCKLSLLPDGSG